MLKLNDLPQTENQIESLNALQLYHLKIDTIPKLLDPFFQQVGLASLVGSSDSGKSTFLRQLSLAIALKLDSFLNFPLNPKSNKVIYVSTEDDANSVSFAIRKQFNAFQSTHQNLDLNLLKNIEYIFDTTNLLNQLTTRLEKQHYDLIIIDAFADVFTKELNANTQVRQFLNDFDKLAKKHNCLILFLHHIGKKTMRFDPSKNSIIGTQAFEAKMRAVLELRSNFINSTLKELWVLKANFLNAQYKVKSYILDFGTDLIFVNTGERGLTQNTKKNDPDVIKKVIELYKTNLSYRDISEKLKKTKYALSKSVVGEIVKAYKKS